MAVGNLFAPIVESPAAQSLAQRLEKGGVLSCGGVNPAAQPFFAASLKRLLPKHSIVVVTESLKSQETFQQDIETWLRLAGEEFPSSQSPAPPLFFPPWEILPHESKLPHIDVISERLQALVALSHAGAAPPLVVTSASALLQKTFPPGLLKARTRTVTRGDRIDPLDLIEWLEEQSYEPEAQVTQRGEIALRGGILDVYPLTSPWPVRLEFFGDELESLRHFDPLTQISREEIASVTIPPGGELGILKRLAESSDPNRPTAFATLPDYLPPQTVLLLCEPALLNERADEYSRLAVPGDPFFIPWEEFLSLATHRGMVQLHLTDDSSDTESCLPCTSLDVFRPVPERPPELHVAEAQRREFFDQLHRWLRQDYAVHVVCNNDGEQQRFREIWRDYGLHGPPVEARKDIWPALHVGSLARGFMCESARLVVATDAEIFGRYKVQRPRRLKPSHATATRSALDIDFAELDEGDLVVHVQHGIGRFLGLKSMPLGTRGSAAAAPQKTADEGVECLVIEYASSDPAQPNPKLYVPVTEAHLVGKYVGAGKARPPLNTLGGTRWKKACEQAERAIRDLTGELLSIQAARETQPGHAFQPDTAWQREFESSFIYEETPDQMRAITETKTDMERPKPMDRLICGDVGFGKTEVAIRAAFKAVMDGRQVAVLVPTTVLAQQHFNTFRERMADYPVRIELLSRFRTRREQQRVLSELAAGAVDIVIGTHRLIQTDVDFKDLGLVVIDEEQRFGVMHKERFKTLRQLVDVLTLSATPIPRTLYLALTGARDMSAIQTPPHDRLPVETIVAAYDERIIRDAIQRELSRGGQVFFLHNRVMTIHTVEQKLKTLVPNARILVGHGQMNSDELEEVMTAFINGNADVLLSTTIIESGLDIPNANTIIIDRADRFGLSDLYQLRGRVGRYKHQAYAYLLLPRHAGLLSDARKRISAIKQYSTLGSGFKIAMRDLEIRGAGNLLGAEQSGHITAVGFELYCQLLKQSIASAKGETVRPRVEVSLRLDFLDTTSGTAAGAPSADAAGKTGEAQLAFLPHAYIPEAKHRIDIYRKLAQATAKEGLDALKKELRDRFGPVPPPVEFLLLSAELRNLAAERGISVIEVKEDKLMLTRQGDFVMVGGKFPRLTKKNAAGKIKEIKKLLLAL